jgi:TIR domain
MAHDFAYDVLLSHSSKDKSVVRAVAARLRADNVRVWFDEWELKPGDSIPAKIEAGLEYSRVLVLCMSAQVFGSDWVQLESQTFRFRDPLNQERRFIPLRLDAAPSKAPWRNSFILTGRRRTASSSMRSSSTLAVHR